MTAQSPKLVRVHSAAFGAHEGGTKFYEVIVISDLREERSLVIRRYGPNNKWVSGGMIECDGFSGVDGAVKKLNTIVRAKRARGYDFDGRPFAPESHLQKQHRALQMHERSMCVLDVPLEFVWQHYEGASQFAQLINELKKFEAPPPVAVAAPPAIAGWGAW